VILSSLDSLPLHNKFQEYQKAIKNLTINEEIRLKTKVQTLEKERTNYDFLNEKIESIQSDLVEVIKMATMNKSPEEVRELYKSFQDKLKK
jgi:DNA replication protein DnaD